MFVDTFIARPVLASVVSFVLVLAGALAIPTMPVAQYPEVAPPQVSVTAIYTGANAATVESAVTTPLEQAINGVEGMLYMTSSSTNSGVSQINVVFEVTRNQDLAAVDVQNRVNQALGRMPGEVRQTGIIVQKQANNFVLGAGVFSVDGKYDSLFLSNYIDVLVKDALKRVPGVADVNIFGERKYSMRLWLDPVRLAARGITAGDVVEALREQNVQVAAGSVGEAPARAGQTYQISVRAAGRLREASEFEDIIVKAGDRGSLVRLHDVGSAELGAETYASTLRFQGQDAVGFGVIALPTANALDVERGVIDELDRLQKTFPPGMQYRVAFNTTEVMAESINEVLKTLAEATVLVVLVMFLFLQNWRATLIPALTLPVSLVGTFAFVKLMGFSINTLTLFAIVLATGIVVDDAIVVIENVERHIQEYRKASRQAASDAMREVFGAVIATALVLVAVFVPIAFFPGTAGRLYAQFALTIAVAVTISAFNALTLTPSLSALLLDRGAAAHGKGRIFGAIEKIIATGTDVYVAVVRGAMRIRWVMVAVFLAGLALTYVVYTRVPQAFVPEEDSGFLLAVVQAPAGSSLEYTNGVAKEVEKILMATPEVQSVFSVMGFSFSGSAPNQGMIFTSLKPFAERLGREHSLQEVVARLRGPLFGVQGAIVVPFIPPSIPGVNALGGFTFEVLDQSGSPNIDDLGNAVQALVGASRQSPRVTGLFSSFTTNDPQLSVEIDRERARSIGLPISEVTSALQIYMGSAYVNDFDFNNRAYRVYVQADKAFRSTPAALGEYYARTSGGEMMPLVARRPRARDDVAAGHQPLQPVPVGHDQRVGRPGREFGTGDRGDAGPGREGAAAGVRLLVVGVVAGRDQGRAPVHRDLLDRPPAGLPHAGRTVRVAGAAVHRAAGRAPRRARRAVGAVGQGTAERRLLPDRPGDADWPGGEERHPDRRVRRAVARARVLGDRRRGRGRADPAPPHPDDVAGLHPRRDAAGVRLWGRPGGPLVRRDGGRRRHGLRHVPQRAVHPGAVCGGAVGPGHATTCARFGGGGRCVACRRASPRPGAGWRWSSSSSRADVPSLRLRSCRP